MTVQTAAGSTLGISAGVPATFNAAGYAALTFTAVGEVTDLGEFGREYALVTHNPVGSRGTVKRKGSFNEGGLQLKIGLDNDDAGQQLAETASKSDALYAFCMTLQNGDKYYFQAAVMSFRIGVGSVDQIVGASINVEITTSATGVGVIKVLHT